MSLINFPLGILVGFAPQFNSVPSKAPRITDPTQMDWINKILLYLSGSLYFINPPNSKNNLQIIILKKIIEKYL